MKAITVSSLRAKMKAYFDEVVKSSEVLIIPRSHDDDEAVVILSLKEYNSLIETDYLLSTKANSKRLLASIKELEDQDTVEYKLDN